MGALDIKLPVPNHDDIFFFRLHRFQNIVDDLGFGISAKLTGIAADDFEIFRNVKMI